MRSTLIIKPGYKDLLSMQNSPQFMIYYYAVLHAAAVFVPINPMSKKLEVVFIQNATDARIVLSGSEVCEYFFHFWLAENWNRS